MTVADALAKLRADVESRLDLLPAWMNGGWEVPAAMAEIDGTTFPVLVTGIPLHDETVGAICLIEGAVEFIEIDCRLLRQITADEMTATAQDVPEEELPW